MGYDERMQDPNTLLLYWWIAVPKEVQLEYLPSIAAIHNHGHQEWKNLTYWITQADHRFTNLTANTKYNMTVFVRVKGTDNISPPAMYVQATTGEDGKSLYS